MQLQGRVRTWVNVDSEVFLFSCPQNVHSVLQWFHWLVLLHPLCHQLTVRHCLVLCLVVIHFLLCYLNHMETHDYVYVHQYIDYLW